jgi:cytochrome c oxidase assembly protein subunit 15
MQRAQPTTDLHRRRVIRLWLLGVAAIVFATVLVGGATRLTESGLSIVEWQPVTGVLPPLSETQWRQEFEKYKAIPQYQQLNRGMSLAEFKTIFWWEWTHRFLGRFIGVAFALPFVWFLWRGWLDSDLRRRLWTILAFGAVQGAVGWWMVSSGLTERTSVSQYRLAFHLTLACIIYAAILSTALRLLPRRPPAVPRRVRVGALAMLALVLAQIYLGALVAGLDAGLVYNTWPLIDGALVPDLSRLLFERPLWRNFFENALTVQFQHRLIAYLLGLGVVLHAIDVSRNAGDRPTLHGALALAAVIALQMGVGIATLLQQTPLPLALLHQTMAMLALTAAVLHAGRLGAAVTPPPAPAADRR